MYLFGLIMYSVRMLNGFLWNNFDIVGSVYKEKWFKFLDC